MDISPQEFRAFITGRADAETKRKIAADLKKDNSPVREMLDVMRLCAQDVLNVDWQRLLGDDSGAPGAEEAQVQETGNEGPT